MSIIASLFLATQVLTAQPSPEHVKEVIDYHLKGQGKGPILFEAVLCKSIDKKSADCSETMSSAKEKDMVHVHLSLLLPKGDSAELMVQALLEGQVRETKDLTVKGESWRSRTWTAFSVKKAGKWEFKVMSGDKTLKSLSLTVDKGE